MARGKPKHNEAPDEEMLPEYDFSGGIRGKYISRLAEGSNLIVLDPDVMKAFPDSESVNRALRLLLEVARNEAAAKVLAEQKEAYKTE